jgi:hypothetical protein
MSTDIRRFVIRVCDDCVNLEGECCNNPYCVFCLTDIEQVSQILDRLMIRPVIDGKLLPEILGEELASDSQEAQGHGAKV